MLAGYFVLHAEDRRHFFLMPEEWQETFSFTGMQFLICLLLWETAQFIRVRRFGRPETTDFAAHFGGYVVGVLSGWWLRQDKERDQERRSKKKRTWIDDLLFSKSSD